MGFTTQTITHTFTNCDGTPASGSVTFRLTKRMTNSGSTIGPGTVTGTLNGTGQLSVSLFANDDTATFPADAQWMVNIRILGWDAEQYAVTVPHSASSPIDLGTLLPSVAPVG